MIKKIIIAGLIIGIIFFIRFVLGGPEDSWICENGKWVKHGQPKDRSQFSGSSTCPQPSPEK